MEEIWKDIPDYEGKYQASSLGRIKTLKRKHVSKDKIIVGGFDSNGYAHIQLWDKHVLKSFKTHRLIAITFIPNPENKTQVNHKNKIKTDNRVENLEWVTPSENVQHSLKTGDRYKKPVKRFTQQEIQYISSSTDSISVMMKKLNRSRAGIFKCRKKSRAV